MKKAVLAIAFVASASAVFATEGSKLTGDSAVPITPCYVNGKLIDHMPINICQSKYYGTYSQKASLKMAPMADKH